MAHCYQDYVKLGVSEEDEIFKACIRLVDASSKPIDQSVVDSIINRLVTDGSSMTVKQFVALNKGLAKNNLSQIDILEDGQFSKEFGTVAIKRRKARFNELMDAHLQQFTAKEKQE